MAGGGATTLKPLVPKPYALKALEPKPYALKALEPKPYALKALVPKPYALKALEPKPYALKALVPKPYALKALEPKPYNLTSFPSTSAAALPLPRPACSSNSFSSDFWMGLRSSSSLAAAAASDAAEQPPPCLLAWAGPAAGTMRCEGRHFTFTLGKHGHDLYGARLGWGRALASAAPLLMWCGPGLACRFVGPDVGEVGEVGEFPALLST